MLFGKRLNRAFERLQRDKAERTKNEESDTRLKDQMEKGDLFAMFVSAFLVLLPAALVVLLIMVGIAVLFFLR
jgi:hypothetical protein